MTLTTFVTWIVVAVVTGWAARIVVKNGGHGTKAAQRKFFDASFG